MNQSEDNTHPMRLELISLQEAIEAARGSHSGRQVGVALGYSFKSFLKNGARAALTDALKIHVYLSQ